MITKKFRSDTFVNALNRYGSAFYNTIYKIWVVLFILIFLSNFIKIPNKIITWLSEYVVYCANNGLLGWLAALVFAPFYLNTIVQLIIFLFSKTREWLYPQNRFTDSSEATILKKIIQAHTSSETTTYTYFVLVNHPFFHNSVEFCIDEYSYNQVNEGEKVMVKAIPNHKNCLLLLIK